MTHNTATQRVKQDGNTVVLQRQPTIAEVVKICRRECGLTCRYSSSYQEFRIDYKRDDPRWTEDTAYFTTYRDDAIATARTMAKHGKTEDFGTELMTRLGLA